MIVVAEVSEQGGACPFQLEGKTDKGEPVYARYRWGRLRVEVAGEVVYTKQIGEDQDDQVELAKMKANGMSDDLLEKMATTYKTMREHMPNEPVCFDGYMDMDRLREVTAGDIQWPAEVE